MSYEHKFPNTSTVDALCPVDRLFVDLDGCIFSNLSRSVMVPDDPYDTAGWLAFEKECLNDEVIQMVADIVRHYKHRYSVQVIFLTGRTEAIFEQTVTMLNHHILSEWDGLVMRPVNEKRRGHEWKLEQLHKLGCCAGDMIMDDCLDTIKAVMCNFPTASFMYTNFGMCKSRPNN
jgi:hypothetical protein